MIARSAAKGQKVNSRKVDEIFAEHALFPDGNRSPPRSVPPLEIGPVYFPFSSVSSTCSH